MDYYKAYEASYQYFGIFICSKVFFPLKKNGIKRMPMHILEYASILIRTFININYKVNKPSE